MTETLLLPELKSVFVLTLPAEIKMRVEARSETDAREVLRGLMGSGDWVRAVNEFGLAFGVRAK